MSRQRRITTRPQHDAATGYVYVERDADVHRHKANAHRSRDELVSEHARYLTPGELTCARLHLAEEMIDLVLSDADALPAPMQARLAGVAQSLAAVVRQARLLR
jgi:hypothetical protein